MTRRGWATLLSPLMTLLAAAPCLGQSNTVPVVTGIFPPGATVGGEVEWAITGRNLTQAKALLVSGAGVQVVEWAVQDETSARARVKVAAGAPTTTREIRVDGPAGLSNLALVRVDRLPQSVEVEPNDEPDKAQGVEAGSAVAAVLKPLDLDYYRILGKPGQRLTVDLEARRVGTSISPVVTVFSATGNAIAQARESPGGDRDCRLTVTLPDDGKCLIQVRDNVYGGDDNARYRLRVDSSPFATGLFPLGGPKGATIELELSGGNLEAPRTKRVALPGAPGSVVDPGEFDGPGGPAASPARLAVGTGPEVVEPADRAEGSAIDVEAGITVNGRLGRPGEVDLYRLKVKAGDKVRARVDAAGLGSWLDSVVVIRDEAGATLAENDDSANAFPPDQPRPVSAAGVPELSPDSLVDYEAKADGVLTIALADRFGAGGPEYSYRLTIGPPRPDFAVALLVGNANTNAQMIGSLNRVRTARTVPGQYGVFNLKPGASLPINFLITPNGRPGTVQVRAEGLPEGVTAEPVDVRLGASASSGSSTSLPADSPSVADLIVLKVSPYARPGLGEVRIVAASKTLDPPVVREATATIGVDSASVSNRPIVRTLTRLPIRIIGEDRPLFVGPPAPPTLRKVAVPGPLLQGDQIDLILEFGSTVDAQDGSTLEAKAEGPGLATNTVISAGSEVAEEETTPDVTIHVLASIKAELGKHPVKVAFTPAGGPTTTREVEVEVRAPVEVKPTSESIFLKPGDAASLKVEVRREPGFAGEVELKVEGLPRGVKVAKGATIASGTTSAELRLEMAADARPLAKAKELRVVGLARMPRGNVAVESRIKPMIRARPDDSH